MYSLKSVYKDIELISCRKYIFSSQRQERVFQIKPFYF